MGARNMLATTNPPLSSFSCPTSSLFVLATNPYPTKLQSLATLSPHERFTLANFAKATITPRFFVPVLGFPLAKHLLAQCGHFEFPPNPEDEIGLIYSFFGEMGFNEKENGLLLEENPGIKFQSFDSIRARVLLLGSVGIKGIELYRVIAKRPDVLLAGEIDAFMHFMVNDLEGNVEPVQLRRLLIATEPRFLAGFDQKVKLLIDHGIPQEKIVYVLNNVNLTKALCLKSGAEIRRNFSFLSRFGGIDIIVRRPSILNFDLDTQLIPRVELLKEISGGDEDATGIVLRKLPAILSYSVNHTMGHVELLRSFADLTDPQIFKIFSVFPNVISASKERKLRPRIEFLKQCGLSSHEIFKFLAKAPVFLGLSFEGNLVHKLVVLVKIGYRHGTKALALAMGAASRTSCQNLQNVIGVFLSYGLSYSDILAMSKRHPQIRQYRYVSLEEKLEFLIKGMGRDIGELLSFPAFLGYNLDERIKHRHQVKKVTIGDGMSLNKILTVSDDRFSTQRKGRKPIPKRQPEAETKIR